MMKAHLNKTKLNVALAAALAAAMISGTVAMADDDDYERKGRGDCHLDGHHKKGKGGMMGFHGKGFKHHAEQHNEDGTLINPLTVERVQAIMAGRLAWQGNPNLKVGSVAQNDAGQIIASIVTQDDSLVKQFQIDPATGKRTMVR